MKCRRKNTKTEKKNQTEHDEYSPESRDVCA